VNAITSRIARYREGSQTVSQCAETMPHEV